ncbi:MAG TPA: hypothetical protein GXX28_03380 [Firmicutes bacterium]|nr:hypothetical protein [Bacillota bacterium]
MRHRSLFVIGVGVFFLLGAGRAGLAAASPAEQILRKALAAGASQTYTGTMVLFTWTTGSGDATVVRVRHRAPGQSRLEYLAANHEPYLVTVDDGIHHWHYHPADAVAVLEPSTALAAGGVQQSLTLLQHNYTLRTGGRGSIAGRSTEIVELVPRGCSRPVQRLWVDQQTGVILRTEQYRFDGSLAALTVFTAFEPVASLPEDLFHLALPKGVRVTRRLDSAAPLKALTEESGFPVRLPSELPPGFVFAGAAVGRPEKENVVHLRFTDGLTVISLFEQAARPFTRYRLEGAKAVALKSGRGWLREECGGYVLNWTDGGINFTLVGEVPAAVLLRLANSFPAEASPLDYVRSTLARLFGR